MPHLSTNEAKKTSAERKGVNRSVEKLVLFLNIMCYNALISR